MDYILKDTPQTMYINKKIYMFVVFLVMAGGINYLSMGALGKDLLRSLLGRKKTTILYLLIGICALLLCFRRDVYLPFLGQAFIPSGALHPKTPTGATDSVKVQVKPGAKVIYWATEPDPLADTANPPSWDIAYGDYDNSGIVVADEKGEAVLPIRGPPQAYKVPMKGRIEPHVHFRVEEMRGLFGSVKTKYIKSGRVEAFSNLL